MRIFVLALLALPLFWFLIAEPLLGRPLRKISIGLLLVLLVPNLVLEVMWQQTEQTGSSIVREVSGKKTGYLHCQRLSETLFDAQVRAGEVRSDQPDKAFATWKTCKDLQGFLLSDKQHPTLDQITAVHVVVHESVHVSGEYNEALTECRAMAADVGVLVKLGTSQQVAAAMAESYRTQVYPLLPEGYRTQCENAIVQ